MGRTAFALASALAISVRVGGFPTSTPSPDRDGDPSTTQGRLAHPEQGGLQLFIVV